VDIDDGERESSQNYGDRLGGIRLSYEHLARNCRPGSIWLEIVWLDLVDMYTSTQKNYSDGSKTIFTDVFQCRQC
jgi:hypothetical protein